MTRLQTWLTGGPRPVWLRYLLLIAAASGIIRFALGTPWMRESAVLYVLIPYLIGIAIYVYTPIATGDRFLSRLWRILRTALIVMMATSLLLFEGFLCVLMFLPIYVFFALLAALINPGPPASDRDWRDKTRMSVLPILVVFLSLDGIRGTDMSFGPERDTVVTRTATLDLTPAQIRSNIINHTYPEEGRTRYLALFPRPVSVEAESVEVGARHVAHMEYRRWGVRGLNVHTGTSVMEFTHSTDTQLRAEFVHDDSYLSHYMRFQTWGLEMTPRADGRTDVTLTVGYERLLAPSWYFGPLQKRAVGDGLDYALKEIIGGEA